MRIREWKAGESRWLAYLDHRPLTLRLTPHKLVLAESLWDSVPLLETILLALFRSRLLASSVRTRSATGLCFLGG